MMMVVIKTTWFMVVFSICPLTRLLKKKEKRRKAAKRLKYTPHLDTIGVMRVLGNGAQVEFRQQARIQDGIPVRVARHREEKMGEVAVFLPGRGRGRRRCA